MNKKTTTELINPFSDKFMDYWVIWKNFKREEWEFEYRGVTSEQMAIKHVYDLSEGDEERAIKIICQSVRRRWQGFWPLHETTTPNGKSKSTTKEGQPSLREATANVFNNRNGGGTDQADSSHLKAV